MENKLLAGGKNIVDRTDAQEKEIQRRRQEILDQKVLCTYWRISYLYMLLFLET